MSTKDWLEKDYYKILGVSKDAKPDDVKRAFRRLARENHPDQTPGNPEAERLFKEVSEANSVLSDPAKRIGRPRQVYVGEVERDYVPLRRRTPRVAE